MTSTTAATINGRSVSGAVDGDDVSLSGGVATFGDKNVGDGKTVTLMGATLAGAHAGNYSLDYSQHDHREHYVQVDR